MPLHLPSPLTLTPLYPLLSEGADTMKLEMLDGALKARNDVFAEEGLSHDTHYIASTGIGGATEGSSDLDKVPYWVVYLRDVSDYSIIDAYMQEHFPSVPRVILEARVCRPSWLIEMECEIA